MAGTIHELWSCGLETSSAEQEDQCKLKWKVCSSRMWDNCNTKVFPTFPDLKHKSTQEDLWITSCCNPSWIYEELRSRRVSLLHDEELHKHTGSSLQALPQSHYALHDHQVPLDDAPAFVALLRACSKNKDLHTGTRLHDDILNRGLLEKCSHALVAMYAKCGALAKAKALHDVLKSRDVFSWTALISGYVREGRSQDALTCFEHMQHEHISPNAVTYTCILKACGIVGAADKGKQIHDQITRRGLLQNNIVLGNALVDMYIKCGALAKAQLVLEELPSRDAVSWSTLITGYAQQGQGEQALNCFEHMQSEGISPDGVTFACVLKACGTVGAIDKGEQIHDIIARQGLLQNDVVLGNALVDMYAKCGDLVKAQGVLEELPSRDVVSWNTLIAGYDQQGQGEQAVDCFERMQSQGIPPNAVTFTCILKACGSIGAIDKGEKIHGEIARQGLLQNNIMVGTALVDMYAKCGALEKACRVLEELPSQDVVSWSALISGYAQQGQAEQAIDCFKRMQLEGFRPDAVTISSVLNACNHLGLVEEGHMLFVNMNTKYGVQPNLEGYTCMIDLFGRAGHLDKAVGLVQEMSSSDFSAIWHALLGACQKWGDVNVGKWAFEQAVQVDKGDWAAYVLMGNIYAAAGMQESAKSIEAVRMENKAWRKPSRTCRAS